MALETRTGHPVHPEFLWKGLPSDNYASHALEAAWRAVEFQTIPWRKAVILCCRAQEVPPIGSQTRLSMQIGFSSPQYDLSLYSFLSSNTDLITSPIWSSLVLEMCRSAPMTSEDVKQARLDSYGKEIQVIGRMPFDAPRFNYDVWFTDGGENSPFHWSLSPNPTAALYVRGIIDKWIDSLEGSLVYPHYTFKKCARQTIREWETIHKVDWDDETMGMFSTATIEQFYHETGIELSGACEMRQKWYRSGVSPRTYYAQGGTSYSKSKYLHGMFLDLVDSLPSTNHVLRLNPTRIRLCDDQYLRIYDLSSFTSNHSELRHFIRALASYCTGVVINVVDARHGAVPLDLGDLLHRYNEMNQCPLVSLERLGIEYLDLETQQNIAGFLGVLANLPGSTFLHGASLLQVLSDPDILNCAGDDVHFAEEAGLEDITDPIIRTNGVVEKSKEFATFEDGAVCLKRGVVQIGSRLLQKPMIIWPSISLIREAMGIRSTHITPSRKTRSELRESVANEIMRFLRSLHTHAIRRDLDAIPTILRNIYVALSLPVEGSVPQCGGRFLCPVLPTDIDQLLEDPLHRVVALHYSGWVVLPLRENSVNDVTEEEEILWVPGFRWCGRSSRKVKYLETLGYVRREEMRDVFWGLDGFERLLKEFSFPEAEVFTFEVLRDVPVDLSLL